MKKILMNKKCLCMMAMFFCLAITVVKAQTPANDPGIFGPGSPGNGPQGDGSPVVPFDGGMSLVLLASGVSYAAKKIKTIIK